MGCIGATWRIRLNRPRASIDEIESLRFVAMATNFGTKIAIICLCVNDRLKAKIVRIYMSSSYNITEKVIIRHIVFLA